jgi:tRNA-modifying protein YgfZ
MSTAPAEPADYAALRSGAAWREVPRDVLLVTGDDAAAYLQGQCSQDVEELDVGASAEALLLSPQGKVDALVRVTRSGATSFVLDTDGGAGPAARERLLRFRLRVRVEIDPASWRCVAVRGPETAAAVAAGEVAVGSPGGPVYSLSVSGPGISGVDLLGPGPGTAPFGWVGPSAVPCGASSWEAVRIETGLPVAGREVTAATIPAEAGLVDRTVSFTKGCFTGQELVARLDSRGSNVARRLCGIVVEGPVGASEADGLVGVPVATGDRVVGGVVPGTGPGGGPGHPPPTGVAARSGGGRRSRRPRRGRGSPASPGGLSAPPRLSPPPDPPLARSLPAFPHSGG